MAHRRLIQCFVAVVLFTAFEARADIPPIDACTKSGESCDNAGTNGDKPGFCTESTCTRGGPDGPVKYDCLRCLEVVDASGAAGGGGAGTGGSRATGGTSNGTGGTSTAGKTGAGGAENASGSSDDGGCSYSGRSAGALGGLLTALSLGAVMIRRRRRG